MADKVLESAVELAKQAAVDAAGDAAAVGGHISATETEERLVTHLFGCEFPGYRGWVWEVVVSRAPRGKDAAVCEAHLVPADDALLAPAWVPWAERVRPGDLEPAMTLPFIKEDPRLVQGYEATGDDEADAVALWELGLGRERVLGQDGRDAAYDRWYGGSHGPTATSATTATASCVSCAFLIPMSGAMRGTFGVCANEWSPSDGKVVSYDHGCGAHSQTDVDKQSARWPADSPVMDDAASEAVDLSVADPEPEPVAEAAPQPDEQPDEQADVTDEQPEEQRAE